MAEKLPQRTPREIGGFFVGRVYCKCQEEGLQLSQWFRENLKRRKKMTNPFLAAMDWINENGDLGGPYAAFIGVGIAVALCFIFGL